MANKLYKYEPKYRVCPGVHIEEIMECYNISEKDFADKIGVSQNFFKDLVVGKERINEKIANSLYDVCNAYPPEMWLRFQNNYENFNKKKAEHRKAEFANFFENNIHFWIFGLMIALMLSSNMASWFKQNLNIFWTFVAISVVLIVMICVCFVKFIKMFNSALVDLREKKEIENIDFLRTSWTREVNLTGCYKITDFSPIEENWRIRKYTTPDGVLHEK